MFLGARVFLLLHDFRTRVLKPGAQLPVQSNSYTRGPQATAYYRATACSKLGRTNGGQAHEHVQSAPRASGGHLPLHAKLSSHERQACLLTQIELRTRAHLPLAENYPSPGAAKRERMGTAALHPQAKFYLQLYSRGEM